MRVPLKMACLRKDVPIEDTFLQLRNLSKGHTPVFGDQSMDQWQSIVKHIHRLSEKNK